MNIRVQRQCDGTISRSHLPGPRCAMRLELVLSVRDVRGDEGTKIALDAWRAAAVAAGWRVIDPSNEGGDDRVINPADVVGPPNTVYAVPRPRMWIACPTCAKAMSLVCYRCHNADCSCVGGPFLSAREGDVEEATGE